MTKSLSGFVFLTVVLTVFRMSFSVTGVMSEIGRYPFTKILGTGAYMHNCIINSLYIKTYFPSQFLDTVMSLWNNVICLAYKCVWVETVLCQTVLQIIFQ